MYRVGVGRMGDGGGELGGGQRVCSSTREGGGKKRKTKGWRDTKGLGVPAHTWGDRRQPLKPNPGWFLQKSRVLDLEDLYLLDNRK